MHKRQKHMPRSYGFNGLKSIATICAVPMELGYWGATYNGLKSIATIWIAPPELQNPSCSNGGGHSNIHYGIEGYKAGQATGFRIFVRRFGLTLECGDPAPLCLAVHWFYPASGAIQFQSGAGSPQSKDCSAIIKYKILF